MTPTAIDIQPDQIYSDEHLLMLLDVSESTLRQARRDGSLQHAKRGRRYFYRGDWVIQWLLMEGKEEAP